MPVLIMKRRILHIFLLSLAFSAFFSVSALAAPTVTDLRNEKAAVESEVYDLQSQLDELVAKTNQLEADLIDTGEKLLKTQADLDEAEEVRLQQYEDMKMRIRYIYESNNTNSFLERILSSKSIADILNEMEYARSIHSYDRDMLKEYEKTVDSIAAMKEELEEKQDELEVLQADYTAETENLNALITEKRGSVANLDAMIQDAIAKAVAAQSTATARRSPLSETTITSGNQANSTGNQADQTQTEQPSGTPEETVPDLSVDQTVDVDIQAPAEDVYQETVGNSVVDRAYGALGLPYAWGATGPGSYDCSGLVGYCLTGGYGRLGTTYTFMTWPQVSDPQPGDICTSWSHCGIYIGNGQMIHAPQTGDVVKIGPVMSDMIFVRY